MFKTPEHFPEIEELNGLCPFTLEGDLGAFEEKFMPLMRYYGVIDEDKCRDLVSSIWLFGNDQWSKGKKWGWKNPVEKANPDKNEIPVDIALNSGEGFEKIKTKRRMVTLSNAFTSEAGKLKIQGAIMSSSATPERAKEIINSFIALETEESKGKYKYKFIPYIEELFKEKFAKMGIEFSVEGKV